MESRGYIFFRGNMKSVPAASCVVAFIIGKENLYAGCATVLYNICMGLRVIRSGIKRALKVVKKENVLVAGAVL